MPEPGIPGEHLSQESNTWALSDLDSRAAAGLAAHTRDDVYWSDNWPTYSSKEWVSKPSGHRRMEAGAIVLPPELRTEREVALAQVLGTPRDCTPYTLNHHVAFGGVVHGWRTVTAQQVAAFVGLKSLRQQFNQPAVRLFNADLIETTIPSAWATPLAKEHALYRPRTQRQFGALQDKLTWAEWVGITGGQPYGGGGHHDRHNVLAAELGLRFAEYADVEAVLGEAFSTHDHLVGLGVGRAEVKIPGSADLTVVRPDGLRIAIELTATTSKNIDRKAERWAKLLSESPSKYTGVVVVFLVAPNLAATEDDAKGVRMATYKAVAAAVRKHQGLGLDPTGARMGVATWRELFPSSHHVADAFFTMRCDTVVESGPSAQATRWRATSFLSQDDFSFRPEYPEHIMAIVENSRMLGQSPSWLRERGLAGAPKPRGFVTEPRRLHALSRPRSWPRTPRRDQVSLHHQPVSEGDRRRGRHEALLSVTEGRLTIDDVIARASEGDHTNVLRGISLEQLLIAQPRVGRATARAFLSRVAAFLEEDRDLTKENIAWLVNGNGEGRRLSAWRDARRALEVCPGFPWRAAEVK